MQIFMTADSVGGVWNFSLQLARELLKRGHSVILASMGSPLSPAQRDSAAALEGLEHHHRPYRLPWMADSATDVERAAAAMVGVIMEHRGVAEHPSEVLLVVSGDFEEEVFRGALAVAGVPAGEPS